MDWHAEGQLIERAVAEMQRQGVGVTPRRVEQVANAVEAARSPEPHAGNLVPASEIAAAYLTPKGPDGKAGGELIGELVGHAAGRVVYMEPVPYWTAGNDQAAAALRDERARLQEEAQGLEVYIARSRTPAHERERVQRRLDQISRRLDEIRAVLQPESTVDRSGARTGIPGGGR